MNDDFDHEAELAGCQAGDRRALQRLYEYEGKWLLGVVYRMLRDRQLAEDVLQEAFLLIWTRADTFDPRLGSARGWMYTVVRHRALKELRSQQRIRKIEVPDSDHPEPTADLETNITLGDSIDAQALTRCLEALEPLPRQCIEAAYVEGYTQTELATRLGKPIGTIKSWMRRGLLTLRGCLE